MNIVNRIEQNKPEFRFGIASIIGGRESQQDYVYCYSGAKGDLAVVCDGMGGMEDGGRASRMVANQLGEQFIARSREVPVPEFFRTAALGINSKVSSLKSVTGRRLNTGSTLVAVTVDGGKLYWISVGDSRIYIIRNREMMQINEEHNYRLRLKEMLRDGTISRAQYEVEEKSRKAEALISYMGIPAQMLMDINQKPFDLAAGDIVLLCSDGLYKSLRDDQILALVRDNDVNLDIAADRLCSMALRYGGSGQDNTSVLLVQYGPSKEDL